MDVARGFGAVLFTALALSWGAHAASEPDQQCLACHGQPGLEKTFDNGSTVALHVEGPAFAASAHAPLGCTGCHADVDLKKHPGASRKTASARAFSIAQAETCRGCHQQIVEAHDASMHGRARDKGGAISAPLCADCHRVHEVGRVVAGNHPSDSCLSCHAAVATHEKWLPNTKKHLEVVACSACHAPGAQRKVDLRLYDPATQDEIIGLAAKAQAAPLDAKGLHDLVDAVNRKRSGAQAMLVGRLEAGDAAATHGLALKGKAVKDCATCHRKGADAFQNVTLSVVGTDGKRARHEVQKDVLSGLTSIDSVRGFYAMGGTRIQWLDVLLGLALVGGISAPLGHMAVRKLMRRKDKENG